MNEENFEQQELFEQKKYISDLVEESSQKNKSSVNIVFGTSIITSIIVLSFLYIFGIFEEEEIVLPEPVTITETIKEKELVVQGLTLQKLFPLLKSQQKQLFKFKSDN